MSKIRDVAQRVAVILLAALVALSPVAGAYAEETASVEETETVAHTSGDEVSTPIQMPLVDLPIAPMGILGGYVVYQGSSVLMGSFDTLAAAFQAVNQNYGVSPQSSYTITVANNDSAMGSTATLSVNTSVTLKSADASAKTVTQATAGQRHITANRGSLRVENVLLDGAGVAGGVVVSGTSLTLGFGAAIENCFTAAGNGAGISATDSTVTLESGSRVKNNRVGQDINSLNVNGGGIYAYKGSLFVASGALVSGNTSTSRGGGIYSTAATTISGVVSNNVSYRNAAGLYFAPGGEVPLVISGATFDGNIAYGYASDSSASSSIGTGGGAVSVYLTTATSEITVSDSTFTNNSAPSERNPLINGGTDYYVGSQEGGAINVRSNGSNYSTLTITSSTFTGNSAQAGAALSCGCDTTISGTVMDGNAVTNLRNAKSARGGAIHFNGSRGTYGGQLTLSITGGRIENGSAYVGAGIAFTNAGLANLFVDGTAFANNQIVDYMYLWDVDNPYPGSQGEINAATRYLSNVSNVTSFTAPSTNIYNNADVIYSTYRYFTFDTVGGEFDPDELADYLNAWYTDYYFNLVGENPPNLPYTPVNVAPDVEGFTRYNVNGSYVQPAPAPTKENDTFLGWYADAAYTIPMESPQQLLDHYTFYALWESMETFVHYDDRFHDGLVVDMPSDDDHLLPGVTYEVSSNVPHHVGAEFVGWEASTDAPHSINGEVLEPGDAFVMPTDPVTLTAVWTQDSPGGGGGSGDGNSATNSQTSSTTTSKSAKTGEASPWIIPVVVMMLVFSACLVPSATRTVRRKQRALDADRSS